MRVDKFLKVARLVKRRTVAQEMIEIGAVRLNGKTCKSSSEVSDGTIIEIAYTARVVKVEAIATGYKVIEERKVNPEEKPW